MGERVGTAEGVLTLKTTGWQQGISLAKKSLHSFGGAAMGTAAGMLGAQGLNMAIRAITGTVVDSVKQFQSFQKAMNEVSTLVDTNVVNMRVMEKGVSQLSRKYGQDADGLAKALYQTVSAGIDAGDALKFLDVATRSAIGGVTDTTTAVDALTTIVNSFGLEADDATAVSDSLFTAIKFGKTTMEELSSVIGRVAPLASSAGLTFDEMNMAVATLTKSGLSTAEAVTALRGILASMLKPTDDAKKAAKELNLEWSTNGMKAAGGFAKFMDQVAQKTGGSIDVMTKLIPRVESVGAGLVLAGEGANEFQKGMKMANEKAGASQEAFLKMAASSYLAGDRFRQMLNTAKRWIGSKISRAISDVAWSIDFLSAAATKNKERMGELLKIQKIMHDNYKGLTTDTKEQSKEEERSYQEWLERMRKMREYVDSFMAGKNKDPRAVAKERLRIENETIESIHTARVTALTSEIKLEELRGSTAQRNDKERVESAKAVARKRAELAFVQQQQEIEMLDLEMERKTLAAGKDMDRLEELAKWYEAKKGEIDATWEAETTAQFEIIQKLSVEFERQRTEQKVKEMAGYVSDIVGLFDDVPPAAEQAMNGMANAIGKALSGDVIGAALTGLITIGRAIKDSGDAAKEAARANREAAKEAMKAANAFVKAQGQEDLTTLSLFELGDLYSDTLDVYNANVSNDTEEGRRIREWATQRMGQIRGEMSTREAFATASDTGAALPDENTATTWAGAKSIVEQKVSLGVYTREQGDNALKAMARKHWKSMSPSEFSDTMALGRDGYGADISSGSDLIPDFTPVGTNSGSSGSSGSSVTSYAPAKKKRGSAMLDFLKNSAHIYDQQLDLGDIGVFEYVAKMRSLAETMEAVANDPMVPQSVSLDLRQEAKNLMGKASKALQSTTGNGYRGMGGDTTMATSGTGGLSTNMYGGQVRIDLLPGFVASQGDGNGILSAVNQMSSMSSSGGLLPETMTLDVNVNLGDQGANINPEAATIIGNILGESIKVEMNARGVV